MAAFVIVVAAAVGAPLPATLLLLALGAFVAADDLDIWPALLVASTAAILGDQIGYAVGRIGGRRAIDAIARRAGRDDAIGRAERFTARWGAPSIFLSRWLVTALGPWVNLSSGVAAYSWPRFLLWDCLGEILWVSAYLSLGYLFHEHVQELNDLLVTIGWLLLAFIIAALSGWQLANRMRRTRR